MRYPSESELPRPEQQKLVGFIPLALTTPAYLISIICWFALVWLSVLDIDGAPVALPLGAALIAHSYPLTVLGAVAVGWSGFFMEKPMLTRLALGAPPLHALFIALALVLGLE